MTCHDARERLSALVDDALGAAEREVLAAHLATCGDCRRELLVQPAPSHTVAMTVESAPATMRVPCWIWKSNARD